MAEAIGLLGFGIDNLHHLVDSRGKKIQHAAADTIIDIGREMKVPFLLAGLERMGKIFDANEQLRGRTGAPIRIRRLDWRSEEDRELFREIIELVFDEISKIDRIEVNYRDAKFRFRMYCSCGGLIGYLVLILRKVLKACQDKRRKVNELAIRRAVVDVVARESSWPTKMDPFHPEFVAELTDESLRVAFSVGLGSGPPADDRASTRRRLNES